MHTQDVAEANIEKIGQLFPNCLTERINENGKLEMAIDFDKLKQELSKATRSVTSSLGQASAKRCVLLTLQAT